MKKYRKDLKIYVLYGGNSSERPGSILSSLTIESALRSAKYKDVSRIDVTPSAFHTMLSNKPDLAFLTLHGGLGEDGSLQGFLEMAEIPYTSSGVAASAISANKVLFNRFVSSIGYLVPRQSVAKSINELKKLDDKFPKIIKPVSHGCSYGVFLVNNYDELCERAKFSLKFEGKIIVEDYIIGKEFAVGIFKDMNTPIVLPVAETKLVNGIFDYETKYPGGEHLYKTIIPAELEKEKKNELENMCKDIFMKLDCKGYVMMDVRFDNKGKFYFLENNTIPGMLNPVESYIPRMLKEYGLSLKQFVDIIVKSSISPKKKNVKILSEKEMVEYLGLKLAEN